MDGRGKIPLPVIVVAGLIILSEFISDIDGDILEDLPFFAVIAAFVLFRVFMSGSGKRERKPAPPPEREMGQGTETDSGSGSLGFEIPPISGAPQETPSEPVDVMPAPEAEELGHQRSLLRHLEEKRAREQRHERERLRREHQTVRPAEPEKPSSDARRADFGPEALRNAVLWSEILAPPKALRHRVRH